VCWSTFSFNYQLLLEKRALMHLISILCATLSLSHTHNNTHSLSHTHNTLSLTHTHNTLSHTHNNTLSLTHTQQHSLTHTTTLSLSHTHNNTLSLTHTHQHTACLMHPASLTSTFTTSPLEKLSPHAAAPHYPPSCRDRGCSSANGALNLYRALRGTAVPGKATIPWTAASGT